ncbi:MAG: thioredoxin family protein [Elusimicrobia bacterium]|nr:thioredoxin family protein [Elusimicrobiota bacterium]
MKKIQILGLGCPKCEKLYESVKQAAKELGIEYEIEKIDDINKIFDMGAMTTLQDGGARTCVRSCPLKAQSTPALAIDGNIGRSYNCRHFMKHSFQYCIFRQDS